MDTQILKEIGLTNTEISTYIAALRIGPTKAGQLVLRTQLANAVVHRALKTLQTKGLISTMQHGRTRIYTATQPEALNTYLEEKQDRLKPLIKELNTITPNEHTSHAQIYTGIRGVKELLRSLIHEAQENYYAYGGAQIAHELFGDHFWKWHHTRRIQHNIQAKLLFHQSSEWWGKKLTKKTTVRYTQTQFEEKTETIICKPHVAIIIYTDMPYGVLLKEDAIVNSYKRFFDILWNAAEKNS